MDLLITADGELVFKEVHVGWVKGTDAINPGRYRVLMCQHPETKKTLPFIKKGENEKIFISETASENSIALGFNKRDDKLLDMRLGMDKLKQLMVLAVLKNEAIFIVIGEGDES